MVNQHHQYSLKTLTIDCMIAERKLVITAEARWAVDGCPMHWNKQRSDTPMVNFAL